MHAVSLTWEQVALLGLTYALVGAIGVFVGALLSAKPRFARVGAAGHASNEIKVLSDELRAIRNDLLALQSRVESAGAAAPPEKVESAYSQAIRLAQQGLDPAAVAAGCGISRGEADLIVAIYRASHRP
jgi:hypothetical protein